MITIEFVPWRSFRARKKTEEIHRWLRAVGDASEEAFKSGMDGSSSPSRPGQYPASRTGRLRGTIRSEVKTDSVTIGTSTPYSGFLRRGTSRMRRRKMSDNALQEGMGKARLGKWVEWTRS